MICVEIEENLARLKEFWSNTENASTFSNSPLSEVQKNDALHSSLHENWPRDPQRALRRQPKRR